MKGRVIEVNQTRGMIAIETDGGITVAELLDSDDIEVGEEVSGDLEAHGGETLRKVSTNEQIEVYIQGVHCSPANARSLMA